MTELSNWIRVFPRDPERASSPGLELFQARRDHGAQSRKPGLGFFIYKITSYNEKMVLFTIFRCIK